jgi:arylsulfatase
MQAHERSVRHGNWLYIRNAYPERQNLCVESGPAYPAGKELWDAHERGLLAPQQLDVFLKPRPAEELYRVDLDPYQFHNLAADPANVKTLAELRGALDRWVDETRDSVPKHPTPDTSVMGSGQGTNPSFKRGDMPGADRHAAEVTNPGPIRQSTNTQPRPPAGG